MSNKILLVEDEANIRIMYAEILTEEGFEVIQVGDGLEAYRLALGSEWDVLLLDIMLPKLDGIELLKKLRKDEKLKNKPVVVLTNLGEDRVRNTCKALGVEDFLVKSNITPKDVILAVKKYAFNA